MSNQKENVKSLEVFLGGIMSERKILESKDIHFGNCGYLAENYIQNYFKEPIYILDSLNNIVKIPPEIKDNGYSPYSNKIIIRSKTSINVFNRKDNIDKSENIKTSEMIIIKDMFDENGIVNILELSLMIGFNEKEMISRNQHEPEVASMISKKQLLDNLFTNSFNREHNAIELIIIDSFDELSEYVYTIINGEIMTIPVVKSGLLDDGVKILYRHENDVKEFNFPLTDLTKEIPEFKVLNTSFYIAHSKDRIEQILKTEYASSKLGIELKTIDEIVTLKQEYKKEIDDKDHKFDKLTINRDKTKLELDKVTLELDMLKSKFNVLIEKIIAETQLDEKLLNKIIMVKEFDSKIKEIDSNNMKFDKEIELIDKKSALILEKHEHEIKIAATKNRKETTSFLLSTASKLLTTKKFPSFI